MKWELTQNIARETDELIYFQVYYSESLCHRTVKEKLGEIIPRYENHH